MTTGRALTMLVTMLLLAAGGCARPHPRAAADRPGGAKEAEVYSAVLRRYLTAPGENSFGDRQFRPVYVLDRAYPGAEEPAEPGGPGTPIAEPTRTAVVTALAGTAEVVFVADRADVVVTRDGCAQVKDGGILVTLGPVDGDDHEVTVGVNGFVACLGATWLTYVVVNEPGTGWRAVRTTGPVAVA